MENYHNNERGDDIVESALNVTKLAIYVTLGVTAILALGEIGDSNNGQSDEAPVIEELYCPVE